MRLAARLAGKLNFHIRLPLEANTLLAKVGAKRPEAMTAVGLPSFYSIELFASRCFSSESRSFHSLSTLSETRVEGHLIESQLSSFSPKPSPNGLSLSSVRLSSAQLGSALLSSEAGRGDICAPADPATKRPAKRQYVNKSSVRYFQRERSNQYPLFLRFAPLCSLSAK